MVIMNSLAFTFNKYILNACNLHTDSIELNVFITQVLSSQMNIILRFAVSDQHSNLSRVRSHPNILFEVILENVVQGHACNGRMMSGQAEVESSLL